MPLSFAMERRWRSSRSHRGLERRKACPLSIRWKRDISAEAVRTANPEQTTGYFGVERGFFPKAVDAGFPLQYDDFLLGRVRRSAIPPSFMK